MADVLDYLGEDGILRSLLTNQEEESQLGYAFGW